jgi:hypothetical protein
MKEDEVDDEDFETNESDFLEDDAGLVFQMEDENS